MSSSLKKILITAAACGIGGWFLENALEKGSGRFSKALGEGIPFLPVYAAGGTLITLGAPYVSTLPVLARFGTYAAGLSALEMAACQADRAMPGKPSWSYGLGGGCVDMPHALLWGALGLAVEAATR